MSGSIGPNTPFVDGFYGIPVQVQESHGPEPGTIEWLLNAVERHANSEAEALTQYSRIAVESGDPVVALVMRLVLDDEERHHSLLKLIESSLRDALNWSHSARSLPSAGVPLQPLPADLRAVARELVQEEHSGARKMRELAQQERGIDGGLHSLLLEMMAMDSEKHARLLQFVQQRLEARNSSGDSLSD